MRITAEESEIVASSMALTTCDGVDPHFRAILSMSRFIFVVIRIGNLSGYLVLLMPVLCHKEKKQTSTCFFTTKHMHAIQSHER